MNKKKVKLIIFIITVVVLTILGIYIGIPLVRYVNSPDVFRQWVNGHGFVGILAYMAMVIFEVVVALVPGEPFEILGGYCFGALLGTLLCIVASTIGSMIVFFLVRLFGFSFSDYFFDSRAFEKLSSINDQKKRLLFFIVFMIPGTPKDLLSYFAGFTDMKWTTWLLICSVGRIPAIITSTIGGDALGDQSYKMALFVFGLTLLISLSGVYLFKRVSKR